MNYIIITPAYNEAKFIADMIDSVISQTRKPLLWVIVDDGSMDNTPEIIKRYATEHPWIRYVRRAKDPSQSYYSSNVYAIFEGIKQLQMSEARSQKSEEVGRIENGELRIENGQECKQLDFQYLAILDADISLPPDYYEQILRRMPSDEKLGIASGVYIDRIGDNKFRKVLNDRRSTPKALMVFHRKCYQDIGGFIPMKYGGEDTVACFSARMKGWKVWSFPDIVAIHNKPVGMGHAKNILKIRFRQGIGEYFLATHPLFFLLKSMRRCVKERPLLIGGLVRIAGFICGFFIKDKRQISDEIVKYIRKEQWYRIVHGNRIPALNRNQVEIGYRTKGDHK